APGSEAPSEMLFYFPDLKALFWAEDVNKTMHNIYTLRGTKARDALGWSKYINELMDLFPGAELALGPHTWPTWGNENIRKVLVNQRDMYRFIHDQALFLANQGKKMVQPGATTARSARTCAASTTTTSAITTATRPPCTAMRRPRPRAATSRISAVPTP